MENKFKKIISYFLRPTIIFIIGGGIIIFSYIKINNYIFEITKVKGDFNALISRTSSQGLLKEQYEAASLKMQKIENALPTTDNLQKVVDAISLAGQKTNNIISVNLVSQVNEDSKDIIFSVSVQGSKDAFFKLLDELEHSRYFSETSNFKITMSNGFSGDFSSSFLLKVYLR
ncbi:MAG: hypothetical protein AAB614_02055 [Patescibacteria group bacterium]